MVVPPCTRPTNSTPMLTDLSLLPYPEYLEDETIQDFLDTFKRHVSRDFPDRAYVPSLYTDRTLPQTARYCGRSSLRSDSVLSAAIERYTRVLHVRVTCYVQSFSVLLPETSFLPALSFALNVARSEAIASPSSRSMRIESVACIYVQCMLQCSFLERDRVSCGLTYTCIYLSESRGAIRALSRKFFVRGGFQPGETGAPEHSGNPCDIKEPINVKRQRVSSYLAGRRISDGWARARLAEKKKKKTIRRVWRSNFQTTTVSGIGLLNFVADENVKIVLFVEKDGNFERGVERSCLKGKRSHLLASQTHSFQ
ncbi:uncharacterized protein LOC122535316 isoform X3 [Frieseomelitta varia]|uniref:uncharacterized protein LOC122535316 isoform X3 n=1 Tax=Frieseomelitta varia TaxID=561572 RepID=UPI001CB67AFF|nr:uncharacterized protein LOC122535316 isoform X3 [Frieseomelitta varia]